MCIPSTYFRLSVRETPEAARSLAPHVVDASRDFFASNDDIPRYPTSDAHPDTPPYRQTPQQKAKQRT